MYLSIFITTYSLIFVYANVLGGQLLIKIGDKMVQYNENFRFYITTKMSNPHYAPEITTKTTLVNFAVKQQGN